MSITPGSHIGPYEITGKLGQGGMGEVYRATDTRLKRDVAIKVLPAAFTENAERLQRFEREAQLLAQLHHPNIASVFGLEESGGTKALVMELVEGPTLADRLTAGRLPVNECLGIALQVAHALEQAHARGIVHRDLKPQNIKASPDGTVKVLDFGLAKALEPAPAATSASQLAHSPTMTLGATQMGMILGTAAYMAPEQAKGLPVDKRADIWAFGVVLYEMLTGNRLFEAPSVPETLAQVLTREPDLGALPPGTPGSVRRLLRRSLARDPRHRLHDIADARIVLEEGDTPEVVEVPRKSREKLAWAVAGACALAALALVMLSGGTQRSTPRSGPVVTRFSVVPREPGTLRGAPAVSPDGRTIVYSIEDADGRARLWAESIETGEKLAIAGVEGGLHAFFSPDSRQLAHFTGGQLVRIDLSTGLKSNVMKVADSRGGTWERSGDILVAVNSTSPILRVSTSTGETRPATQLAAERGEQSHRFPCALPGGEFLYTSQGSPDMRGIWWHPKGDGPARKLVPDVARAAFDERGYMLWVRDDVLVAQRLDAATGVLSGEIQPLAQGIDGDSQVMAEQWYGASAAGTVAYRVGTSSRHTLVWLDRSGKEIATFASPGRYYQPSLSPDGAQVAAESGSDQGVWIYDTTALDRGRRLTFGSFDAEQAVWSREGRWIAYSSARQNGWSIFRKAADGSGDEELLFEAGAGSWPDSWGPGDRSLLIERFTSDHGVDLWILSVEGERKAVPLLDSPSNEAHGAFSPDGRLIAYVADYDGIGKVYVSTVAAPSNRWQISKAGADWPAWSADGRELYFCSSDRMLHAVPVTSTAPFSFGVPVPLFRMNTPEPRITSSLTYYAPAPDGRRFLVSQLVGERRDPRIEVITGWSPQGP